ARMVDEAFKVADLAEAMGQDRSHLFRRVREVTGQAPSDLIRNLRLERAAELLHAEAGPIGEIAYAVGFSSVAHFTKCFRERYGRTPGQSRGIRVGPIAA
ncbi:MAG: helix-turn-helix transcriptional regulator, partial [Xanthomonadales bacterium]|nr:helix-turn-helix transcriptional regulator [Xanthomonadales bacterium]